MDKVKARSEPQTEPTDHWFKIPPTALHRYKLQEVCYQFKRTIWTHFEMVVSEVYTHAVLLYLL